MPGKRNARSRGRGSWAARLIGVGLAIVLAGVGVALYLIYGNKASQATALPTRVLGTQAVGLVNPGRPPQAGASTAGRIRLPIDLFFTAPLVLDSGQDKQQVR